MDMITDLNIRFSSGPAAANLYVGLNNINYRLCFDWSFDYIYWKVNNNLDIEINLENFDGVEKINTDELNIFIFACKQMIQQTQNYNYEKVNVNRDRLVLLVDNLIN